MAHVEYWEQGHIGTCITSHGVSIMTAAQHVWSPAAVQKSDLPSQTKWASLSSVPQWQVLLAYERMPSPLLCTRVQLQG